MLIISIPLHSFGSGDLKMRRLFRRYKSAAPQDTLEDSKALFFARKGLKRTGEVFTSKPSTFFTPSSATFIQIFFTHENSKSAE
jgi:hypothetical protein